MTKTIEQKIADKEASIESLRKQYRSIGSKINRGVTALNKLIQERDADKVEAVWNETDPAKIDWDFFLADGPGSPFAVDYNRSRKKLAELFGIGEDRYYQTESLDDLIQWMYRHNKYYSW